MNVPAQVCEFLVNALQSHYEGVVLCCVESGGVSDKSRNALEAGRRKLFISQSKWNAGEKDRWFRRPCATKKAAFVRVRISRTRRGIEVGSNAKGKRLCCCCHGGGRRRQSREWQKKEI